uniref:LEA5 protein n=1 Tax=Steinernema carpocapsae TaxID=34508 RepID=A5H301_STECR|nr:LEA5 protein [Steinernema carpocapsae]
MDTVKEKLGNAYESTKDAACDLKDKVTGRTTEDKAADKVKEGANKAAEMAKDARDAAGDKMHEAGKKFQS